MPLIQCPDCERKVSDMAPACPGCGRPFTPVTRPAAPAAASPQEIFLLIDDKPEGPLADAVVMGMLSGGEVPPSTLCARAGAKDWVPLSTVFTASMPHGRPQRSAAPSPAAGEHGVALIGFLILLFCGLCGFLSGTDSGVMFGYIVIGVPIYFLPAYLGRFHRQATAITALNVLLGWTLLGWVAALVWAVSDDGARSPRTH